MRGHRLRFVLDFIFEYLKIPVFVCLSKRENETRKADFIFHAPQSEQQANKQTEERQILLDTTDGWLRAHSKEEDTNLVCIGQSDY